MWISRFRTRKGREEYRGVAIMQHPLYYRMVLNNLLVGIYSAGDDFKPVAVGGVSPVFVDIESV